MSKYTQFEKQLVSKISEKIFDATPGVQVQVHSAGKKICDISVGTTYPYYDLASLTKIIFSVQTMMWAFEQKKWKLDSLVREFVPWYKNETSIKSLLTHTSGLIWWRPLYQELNLDASYEERREQLARILRDSEITSNAKAVYSDVGFLLLGFVLEGLYQMPLEEVWKRAFEEFYSGSTLHFCIGNKPKYELKHYAPTEDCQWRKQMLQGQVHDDNTWALGGLSSHAGLFGSIDDMSWYALMLRAQYLGISRSSIKSKTMNLFWTKQIPSEVGDWALGFMMPTVGSASCGRHFSTASIGHTGFTGTSFWYDPQADLSVSILSNRVYLGRENKSFALLRPEIHNWVIEGLKRG
jgi:serine-type D-Ala-D-Ala carboxypeptidase